MTRLLYGVIILALVAISVITVLIWTCQPVAAFTEPTQSADNASDVVLWYGEDQDLEGAAEAGGQVIADAVSDAVDEAKSLIIYLVAILGLAALGYIRGDKPLIMLAGLAMIGYGFTLGIDPIWLPIVLVAAGCFMFIRGMTNRGIAR